MGRPRGVMANCLDAPSHQRLERNLSVGMPLFQGDGSHREESSSCRALHEPLNLAQGFDKLGIDQVGMSLPETGEATRISCAKLVVRPLRVRVHEFL